MHTFREVQRAFPYLVSKEFASGGGDVRSSYETVLPCSASDVSSAAQVPEFKWHIIDDRVPFEIEDTGIKITPFAGTSSGLLKSCLVCDTSDRRLIYETR